ncbi:hypothetical protein MNEG_7862 [Monoraphidium neglectum]|uniref:Uncharacterized protein n=1 Tax=Monoraphidium neglectum TaxID=145388 RepID=A0A0D2MHE7_9CHLO|nr:hypothetical protein MNEG_7862 [Monoraphidium neglectum]KIZ00102.1 hypothetical protein MNEG_7862 [Monoraphidium neglectum]|eukprot:XP_013899121.1 hypothetical protein MNEG_7862 [Monoraphidium neglectum]
MSFTHSLSCALPCVPPPLQYADPKALAHVTTPVFAINGDKDLFCPAAGAFKTINLFGGPHRRFLFLGPAYGTTRHHYGHFCPIIGRHIKTEVFPHIEAFMAEFDSADTADTAAMIATKHKFGCAAAAPGNSAPGPPQRLPLVPAAVQAVGAKDCA